MQLLRTRRTRIVAVFAILAIGLSALAGSAFAAGPSVFINEIHYDNASSDAGEAVEIAGPAGTDLTGWSVVFYNGSGGATYSTLNLSGTISDQDNGFGTLSFAESGIQNGAPDGLALVDGSSTVIQFLSYEGSFAATNGPANGMSSTDIGVSETGSTLVGDSLQLTGTGTGYDDFTWAAAAPNTFGSVNTGQTFSGGGPTPTASPTATATPPPSPTPTLPPTETPAPASVIINEVDADQTGTDSAEFVELYDGGVGSTDLSGLVLVLYNGSSDTSYQAFDLDGQSTNGSGYFVLCGDAANVANCDLDVSPDTNLIQNGADAVALHTGDATDFPNGTAVSTTGLLDAIVYDTNDADDAGLLVLLNAAQPQVNEDDGTDATLDSNQRCPNGAGGALNTDTYAQFAPSPGTDNNCTVPTATPTSEPTPTSTPEPVSVIINEVDADQVSTDSAEFIELYDGGVGNTDLSGLSLVFYNGSDDLSYDSFDLDGQSTNGSGYFVLCGDAANVANCDLDVSPNTNLIQNGEDAVALIVGDAVNYPNDTALPADSDIVDAIVYETGSDTDSGLLVLLNAGQGVVDEGAGGDATADSNSRCPNGAGGARNTDAYSQEAPSPGADNTCPVPAFIINEVDADQAGTDAAEFVEIYDGGLGNSDLSGLSLVFYNGSDDLSYVAFDLDGQSTNGSGYFVLCGDAANVANCDLDVSPNTNLIQNGEDAVALIVGDAINYPNDTALPADGDIVDALVYETGSDTNSGLLVLLNAGQGVIDEGAGGNAALDSNQRCPNGDGGARNTDAYTQDPPSPGIENDCTIIIDPPFGMCLDPATLVHDVQGNGTASPLINMSGIIVEGIVIGDYQDTVTELAGFYIQEEDAEFDGDPQTSEGIFINDNGFGTDVVPGDVVRVQGTVLESFGLTQLGSITNLAVCSSGATASETTVTLPITAVSDWEFVEGMLVTINQELSVTENFNTGRFGEVHVSIGGRLFNPTNVTTPGAAANALQDLNNRSRMLLDDASTIQNPLPLPPYLGPDNTLRAGDTIPSLTGVLTYGFSSYRMQPVGPVTFTRVNDRQAAPTDVGGSLKVASFNVLNYFTTIDTGASICGPGMNLGCRGADTPDEFTRQRDKVISAITTMNVDVIGINEIENNTITAIQDLVDGLNAVAGAGTYSFIDTGTIGTDAIRVAIIYKPAKVTPVGAFAVLDSSVDPLFIDTKNRPAMAQTFEENATGAVFTIAVNHFKSKGSACDDVGDPNAGDGQGNCNGTRTNAATALVNWLATDPTGSGDPDFLITGDLNAYAMEDPVSVIKNAGYSNLIESYLGLHAYSFNFQGQSGYLDHALTTPSLTAQVSGLTEWHINADEPSALDYNNFNQPLLYNADPYRASDHDPVIVGLSLEIPAVAEVSDFVVLADESAYLQYRTEVNSGDVGANNASNGPFVFYHDEVVLSYLVKMLDPTSRVLGDDVRLQYGAQAYDVYHNGLTNQGSVLGSEFTPVNLPLVSAMPDVPSFTAGTQTVIVGVNQTVTLAPGDYGKLYALRGSTVVLTGGDYTFENWIVSRNAEVVFDAASNVNIEKRLYTSRDVYIGPSTGSGLTAADIRIIATGANGDSGHLYDWPKTVFIGFRNTVVANIYAPNGLLWLYSRTDGTGAFIGQWVLVGDRVTLTHDSGW